MITTLSNQSVAFSRKLIDTFERYVGTELEPLLLIPEYVQMRLKTEYGLSEYELLQDLSKGEWEDAWMLFYVNFERGT